MFRSMHTVAILCQQGGFKTGIKRRHSEGFFTGIELAFSQQLQSECWNKQAKLASEFYTSRVY
jgi:hypothetical protein